MHIRFIGFGEAARAFTESLAAHRPDLSFSCYDILFEREGPGGPVAEAARGLSIATVAAPTDGIEAADWVVLAVTAESSLDAARSVAAALSPRHTVVDINSVSPERKRRTAELVGATGAGYLDMAVMAPVKPAGHRTPVLVAGRGISALEPKLSELDFRFETVAEAPGEATAIKMVRSVFVKGLEALTAQTLLAAERSGCLDRILPSLAKSYAGLGWPEFPEYQIERMTTHGVRRAAEMRESAATLDELGLGGDLVREVAKMQEKLGRIGTAPGDLRTSLKRLSLALEETAEKRVAE